MIDAPQQDVLEGNNGMGPTTMELMPPGNVTNKPKEKRPTTSGKSLELLDGRVDKAEVSDIAVGRKGWQCHGAC